MSTHFPESPEIAMYIAALDRQLEPLPPEERADIVKEISSHLADGLVAGDSPTTVLARMGPVTSVARSLLAERLVTVDRQRSIGDHLLIVAWATLKPFALTFLIVFGVMSINTYSLYAVHLAPRTLDGQAIFKLLVLNTPATMMCVLPVAMLFLGLVGIPTLAQRLSLPTFRRMFPALFAGSALIGLVASGLGFWFNDTIVISANQAAVNFVKVDLYGESPRQADDRSPQELSYATLAARISRRGPAQALSKEVADTQSTEERVLHERVSIPFMCFGCALLGAALGFLAARLKVWVLVQTGVGLAITALIAGLVGLSPSLVTTLGERLAAWSPSLLLVGLASCMWIVARLSWRPEATDV